MNWRNRSKRRSDPPKVAPTDGVGFALVVRRRSIKRRSATHANSGAAPRGLKPHGYHQNTAPRCFTSRSDRLKVDVALQPTASSAPCGHVASATPKTIRSARAIPQASLNHVTFERSIFLLTQATRCFKNPFVPHLRLFALGLC